MLIAKLLAAGLLVWFALLLGLVLLAALRGDIETAGFLSHSANTSDEPADPERVLAMAVFPVVVGYYVLLALNADVAGTNPARMPDIPEFFVALLTGSNGLYLAGKIARSDGAQK